MLDVYFPLDFMTINEYKQVILLHSNKMSVQWSFEHRAPATSELRCSAAEIKLGRWALATVHNVSVISGIRVDIFSLESFYI